MSNQTKTKTLSRTSRQLLASFDDAAQSHGWEADQGSDGAAAAAKQAYNTAKEKLKARLLRLEKKARALTGKEAPRRGFRASQECR